MSSGKSNKLNPTQADAVAHTDGPLLVLAGAGSGKTRIITERISYLIGEKNINPSNILAVTFTNKAANEMKERIHRLIGDRYKGLWIGTFHSVSLRILKREIKNLTGFKQDFVIYDEGDQIKLIKECMSRLNIGERTLEPRSVRSKIDSAKNKGLTPEQIESHTYNDRIAKIYDLYEKELRKLNALDFADLLYVTTNLFEEKPEILRKYQDLFHYILVDEYQDTNHMQYKIIELLSRKHRNVFVVGDDNQSIYGWRGADITNILNFERDFKDARVIKLERNYRSTKTILKAANELILKNKNRHDKNLWTEKQEGEKLSYYEARDERDEARHVVSEIENEISSSGRSYKDIAVFFRTNNQSRIIEEEFLRRNLPYTIVGGVGFYQRAEIKDVLAFLKVIANPLDNISLGRIINVPPRGIGKGTVDKLDEIARREGISLFDSIERVLNDKALPARATKNLERFFKMLSELIEMAQGVEIGKLLDKVLQKTGYLDLLEKEEERRENVGEILNLAAEFEKAEENATLHDFLDWVSLSSDVDRFNDKDDRVALLTLHSAKGLEFPVIFIIGMEENLIPHFNSTKNGEVEEERRLLYVGLTRAKEKVYLTGASRRRVFGKEERPVPSRFIAELPKELLVWNNHHGSRITKTRNTEYTDRRRYGSVSSRRKNKAATSNGKGYRAGQIIEHPMFGEGVIKRVEGTGGSAKITVSFPGRGTKKIIASYLERK